MTERQRNLFLAAKLIRRLDEIDPKGDFEGSSYADIAFDCQMAATELRMYQLGEAHIIGNDEHSKKWSKIAQRPFLCAVEDLDESGGVRDGV
jgi:hypothetical protein